MSFLTSYKRLDNLCKDLFRSEKGVAAYINNMEQLNYSYFKSENFDYDYKTLKHYRHIRNQIAHENYADEDNMCNENDVMWIENFHQRILNQTDPIAQYYKASKERQQPVKVQKTKQREKPHAANKKTSNKLTIIAAVFLIAIVTVCFLQIIITHFGKR